MKQCRSRAAANIDSTDALGCDIVFRNRSRGNANRYPPTLRILLRCNARTSSASSFQNTQCFPYSHILFKPKNIAYGLQVHIILGFMHQSYYTLRTSINLGQVTPVYITHTHTHHKINILQSSPFRRNEQHVVWDFTCSFRLVNQCALLCSKNHATFKATRMGTLFQVCVRQGIFVHRL